MICAFSEEVLFSKLMKGLEVLSPMSSVVMILTRALDCFYTSRCVLSSVRTA